MINRVLYAALIAMAILGIVLVTIPPSTLIWRTIAEQTWQASMASSVQQAVRVSLWTSLVSILIIFVTGTPLAYLLVRYRFFGQQMVAVVVELPIVLPPATAGLALLLAFGRTGWLGGAIDSSIGINIAFSAWAVILAQVFVAMPFFVRTLQVGFRSIPPSIIDAAVVDGADELALFRLIMVPLARPAILAGLSLSWARALGEFGATILFAGNLPGSTQTLSLLVYTAFEQDIDAAIWTAVILLAIAAVTMIVARLLLDASDKFWHESSR